MAHPFEASLPVVQSCHRQPAIDDGVLTGREERSFDGGDELRRAVRGSNYYFVFTVKGADLGQVSRDHGLTHREVLVNLGGDDGRRIAVEYVRYDADVEAADIVRQIFVGLRPGKVDVGYLFQRPRRDL